MNRKKKARKADPFTQSDKHVLDGVRLFPWTPSRVIAAQTMGMLYPEIGKEGWDQYRRTKVYPGAVKDVIICLWLCTQNEEEVDLADCAPVEAYNQARKWAASLGIHDIKGNPFWQAYNKFAEIMGQVDKAMTFPKNSGEEPDEGND